MEKKFILIADPSAELRLIFRHLLKKLGPPHRVIEAEDGLEAIAYLQSHPITMAFVEINLPKFCGVELLEWVQAAPLHLNFFLFYSDSTKYPHLTRSDLINKGAKRLLTKPFDLNELERALKIGNPM